LCQKVKKYCEREEKRNKGGERGRKEEREKERKEGWEQSKEHRAAATGLRL
jgi:hypothetical protein